MRWPPDHPAVADSVLAAWADGAEHLCPEAEVVRILRHLPGRRVSTLVRTASGEAVLKIFASPRARGGHRRLSAFADSDVADLVPLSRGQRDGHVALVEFVHGTPLDNLEDGRLVPAAEEAGRALRRIHGCAVALDRAWTVENEIAQLRRTAGPATREGVEDAIRRWTPPETGPSVPSHRDFHPAQAVLTGAGIRFIDLDDAAMATPGLDVGNFVAHLRRDAAVGARAADAVAEAIEAFLNGYGEIPDHMKSWERISLARLAALAETRHGSLEAARRLLLVLEQPDAHLPERSEAGSSNQPHGGVG